MGVVYEQDYDSEAPAFYLERMVRAVKDHKCSETGLTIPKGTLYWRITGKWDGEVSTHKISRGAMELIHRTKCNFGELKEFVENARFSASDPDLCIAWDNLLQG